MKNFRQFTLLGKLKRCTSGMAATEFALVLPIMVSLYIGTLEIAEALQVNRRATIAANTLSDLLAQIPEDQISIDQADLNNLFDGVEEILQPHDTSFEKLKFNVVSVVRDAEEKVVVHWSSDRQGASPYPADEEFQEIEDGTLVDVTGSIIYVEVIYEHELTFTRYLPAPLTFRRSAIRWPRNVNRVQFCENNNDCTT